MRLSSSDGSPLRICIISDTHGVWDPALETHIKGAHVVIHAGDLGHHGGSSEVMSHMRACAPSNQVLAVAGNTDDGPDAAQLGLPACAQAVLNGWKILVMHVVGLPPKMDPCASQAIARECPDIVICGHSHVPHHSSYQGVVYINPGSAGPARFKLPRAAAMLILPPKAPGAQHTLTPISLPAKAPSRTRKRPPPALPQIQQASEPVSQASEPASQLMEHVSQPGTGRKRRRTAQAASGSKGHRARD